MQIACEHEHELLTVAEDVALQGQSGMGWESAPD